MGWYISRHFLKQTYRNIWLRFAARGYAVVAVNFHGSTGFGQEYCDSIRGDWGGQPYRDVMAAVDWAVAAFEWIDPERIAALGASYGGYMMNWINGHTQRFEVYFV